MNNNQKKGIAFIVGGVLSIFIIPFILELLGLYVISYFLTGYYIIYIIAFVLVGIGIKTLLQKNSESEEKEHTIQTINKPKTETTMQSNQSVTSGGTGENKVVNVTLTGGIIGMLAGSPQSSLNKIIEQENSNGWRVIQIIPADSGNIFLAILRLLILCLTFLLYTTANGYYVIMERKN